MKHIKNLSFKGLILNTDKRWCVLLNVHCLTGVAMSRLSLIDVYYTYLLRIVLCLIIRLMSTDDCSNSGDITLFRKAALVADA